MIEAVERPSAGYREVGFEAESYGEAYAGMLSSLQEGERLLSVRRQTN